MSNTKPEPGPGQSVILDKGKDRAVKNRHHWIFSGAVKSMPDFEDGSLLPVQSAEGEFLGTAYFNKRCSIIGRMVSFDKTPPLVALERQIDRAIARRRPFFGPETNAFRLVNGEGDAVPGLVVDQYDNVLVLQVSTLGMERLKHFVVDRLVGRLAPRSIYEKSNLPSRREEGLQDSEGLLSGENVEKVEILENGLRFVVELLRSQKTGFYLDQRENRRLAESWARGRTVLNCFSYTGAFSVFALKGGALSADCVDTSEHAIDLARENCRLNGFQGDGNHFFVTDAFDFLRQNDLRYDFVILDPPAFAKKKTEVVQACRGYKDIHRIVFQKVLPGSLVMTFSCSFFVDEALFQQVIFQAAREASRDVRILQRHHQAYDHPLNIYHPESDYLKGFLLSVD
jgi:23S rRNA (cytosine1962-C5)-methyltransferase